VLNYGSNLSKIGKLLQALERQKKHVDYYALDLDLNELERSFAEVNIQDFSYVVFHGLHGTYDDAQRWLKKSGQKCRTRYFLSLGSSLGQCSPEGVVKFLRGFAMLLKQSDVLVLGLDGNQDGEKVYRAFNDKAGVTHRFYRNGLDYANRVIGHEAFHQSDWDLLTEYDQDAECHKAYFSPKKDVLIDGAVFRKGERVLLETAYVFPSAKKQRLWTAVGVVPTATFTSSSGTFCKYSCILAQVSKHRPSTMKISVFRPILPFLAKNGMQLIPVQAFTFSPPQVGSTACMQARWILPHNRSLNRIAGSHDASSRIREI
jgi:L-histidine Nalpha-methyltransferase / hercynylcysteine S-oxide synthase